MRTMTVSGIRRSCSRRLTTLCEGQRDMGECQSIGCAESDSHWKKKLGILFLNIKKFNNNDLFNHQEELSRLRYSTCGFNCVRRCLKINAESENTAVFFSSYRQVNLYKLDYLLKPCCETWKCWLRFGAINFSLIDPNRTCLLSSTEVHVLLISTNFAFLLETKLFFAHSI